MLSVLGTHLLFSIFLFSSFTLSFQQVCNHHDQSSLLTFSNNIIPLNWSSSLTNCCHWEGIECNIKGRVTHLQLPSRGLKGVISSSITTLSILKIMDLSSNNILGSIPQEIGELLYLEKLHLWGNNLTGPIPSSLMYCTHLMEILLSDNHLNGDISKIDFSKLVHLQKLDLRNNSLDGALPKTIYSCKSLVALGVSQNFITTQISPEIVELKSLSFVSVSRSSLTNITSTLKVLAKLKNLTTLFISSNFYGESLPVHRDFLGVDEFPKLQFFAMQNCEFEPSPFPAWLSTFKNLRVLGLKGNRMIGRLPNWLGNLPKLFTLEINNNSLSGELPSELFQLPALISDKTQLDLKFSQFELPIFFTSNRGNSIRFKSDYYHGLGLSYNDFSGVIPKEIGNLQYLQLLFLNNNSFSGCIPTTLSNLRNIEIINLSTNNLTGEIPTSLVRLSFLSKFDASQNDLEGPIPTRGQFGTFVEASFEGNPGLCGEPLNHSCSSSGNTSTPEGKDENGRGDKSKSLLDGLFVGFASGFTGIVIVAMSYLWFKYCKDQLS